MMKKVGWIVLAAVLAVLSLGSAEAGWEGKSAEELIAAWGEPTKTKRRGEDGKVLIYRLRFFGKEVVGHGGVRWSDLGIGPSPVDNREQSVRNDLAAYGSADVRIGGGQQVLATQKVRFLVDRNGVIVEEKISPFKWKAKP